VATLQLAAWTASPAFAKSSQPYRPGIVLVGFRPGVSGARQRALERAVRASWKGPLGNVSRATRSAHKLALRLGAEALLHVPRARVAWAVRLLRSYRRWIRFAEPDYLMRASAAQTVPNDPSFGLQWGSLNTGQLVNGTSGLAGADDRAASAWGTSTGSHSIVIGEVDTGVEYTHPDLAANVWSNPGGVGGCAAGTHGYNVVAGSCDPMDDDTVYGGHGTHVAGIMGAVGNNGAGVAGVNWSTSILPVKWLDSNASGSTAQLISALDWLVTAKQGGVNVRVVNDSATFVGTAFSQALSDEIDLLGANEILFVTAAGNTGQSNDDPMTPRYPCGYHRPTEICVTASDQNDALASFANYGPNTVDLTAPGDNVYSTLRNGTYGYISGGSMASAQVSGAAALILSAADMTATSLKADILDNVDPIAGLSGLVRTGGRLDICQAIPGCQQPPAATIQAVPAEQGTSAVLNGSVGPQSTSTSYHFRYSPNRDMSAAIATATQSVPGPAIQAVSQTVTGLQPNTTYYFQVVASNVNGTTSGIVLSFSTARPPPEVLTQSASSVTETSAVVNGSVDPESSPTTYAFKYSSDPTMQSGVLQLPLAPQNVGAGDGSQPVSLTLSGLEPSTTYYFQLVATNAAGATNGAVMSFVTPASPPAITPMTPSPPSVGVTQPTSSPLGHPGSPQKPSYGERVPAGQTIASLLARGLTIRVRCAARCSITAELLMPVVVRLSRHRHRTTLELLGKVSKTLSGDRTLQFTITLSHAGRRALLHLSRVVLTLELTAIAPGAKLRTTNAATTSKLQLTLIRPKSPHHTRR
jgi:subtilisin family serine protease